MNWFLVVSLCCLVINVISTPIGNKSEHAFVVDQLDIAPVWAGHSVGFALVTKPPYQYVAYYDSVRELTVV